MDAVAIAETTDRLNQFFERFEQGSRSPDNSMGLRAFLASAKPLWPRVSTPHPASVPDTTRFVAFLSSLQTSLARAADVGTFADPWTLSGLKRREVANAAVLAGLWSRPSNGCRAVDFLSAFLDRLRPQSGAASLPDRETLLRGYVVRTEDKPLGDATDRVDITIEGNTFLIAIEVKIDAGFQPDQLGRYRRSVERRASHRGQHGTTILLAPRRIVQTEAISASWHDIALAGRSILLGRRNQATLSDHLIERFTAHVARF